MTPAELFQVATPYEGIKETLAQLYREDPRPWLVGFSGGKDSTMLASLVCERPSRNGLTRHPDLPRVRVSNPIQFLSTEEVWAYLLQHPNPWGGDNRALFKLYSQAGGGKCPIQIDTTSTPACGNWNSAWRKRLPPLFPVKCADGPN